jgi:restriction endonuclease S subunit
MSPRPASDAVIPGLAAVSVGHPGTTGPGGWQWVRLTDVARLESGHTPSRKHPEYWGGDVPWVSLPDARENHGRVIRDTTQKTNEKGLANSAARLLPKNTVCLSRTASVGYVLMLGRPMATSQDFVNWVCSDALDPRFLMYALMAEGDHILNFGRGTTHTTIYFPEVLAFHLSLAPLTEQRRIVEKIEAVLAELNVSRERLALAPTILRRFRQSVLSAACSGRLTEDWRADQGLNSELDVVIHTASNDLEDADEHLEGVELPESWTRARVDTLVRIQNGRAFPSNKYQEGGVRLLRPGNLRVSGRVEWTSHNTVCLPESWARKCPESIVGEGELLMNLTAQSLKDEFLGRACIKEDGEPALLNQRIARLVPHGNCDLRPYLLLYFKSKYFRSFVNGLDTGSLIRHMHSKDVARHVIPLPPAAEQREIVRRVNALITLADAIERHISAAIAHANKLTQAVLAKAFRGELVTTEAELARAEGREYESATQLLERIHPENGVSANQRTPQRRQKRVLKSARQTGRRRGQPKRVA